MLTIKINDTSFRASCINALQAICEDFINKEPWHTLSETIDYMQRKCREKQSIIPTRCVKIVHEPKSIKVYDKFHPMPAFVIENNFTDL